jgi:hypothetical protein
MYVYMHEYVCIYIYLFIYVYVQSARKPTQGFAQPEKAHALARVGTHLSTQV